MIEPIFYATHNEIDNIDYIGTSLKGYIVCTYEELVDAFGEPIPGEDKTDFEWHILFADEGVATVYNWKDGPNYGYDIDPKKITEWHIGGKSRHVLDGVSKAVDNGQEALRK